MGNVPVKKTRRARRRRSTTALDRYVPQIGMPPLVESNGPDALETGHKLWRRRWVIITGIILGGAAAALVSWSMPTLYTSEARILVGVQGPRMPNIETILADISADAERVQDEGFVLQSRALAKQVIGRLNLLATRDFDPEFNPPPLWARSMDPFDYLPPSYNPLQYLPTWLTGNSTKHPPTPLPSTESIQTLRENRAVDLFLSRVDVSTLGRSHVLSVKASAMNGELAASIANTLAEVYIEHQRDEKINSLDRVDKFLFDRVRDFRKQVRVSDQAVQDYRRDHGLYKSGNGSVTNQQLTELSTQLIAAQTAKVEAETRLQEARQLRKGGTAGESVPEVLRSPLIASLKQQQADSERRLAEMTAAYGERHPLLRNARAEAGSIAGRVSAEMSKIVDGLSRDARTAEARYTALRANFENLKGQMGEVNDQSIQLESLERDATVNRNLLEAMLNRAKQTLGSADILQANAKLVSTATPAETSSFPPRKLLTFLGSLVGLLFGAAIALVLESADRTFRRADQVEALTGLPVLAMVPHIRARSPVDNVVREPFSAFSESLRRLFLGVELSEIQHSPKTLLFTSAAPAEGKSVIVASLGAVLRSSGKKVLLIDCDWRRPRLHHHFRCSNRNGLAQILAGDGAVLNDCIHHDPKTGIDVMPAGDWTLGSAHCLRGERMHQLLELCSEGYDTIILDAPPVLLSTDVLSLARMVEKVVFVVRWGHTPRAAAVEGLKQILEMKGAVAGVVMSRVVAKKYRQYGPGGNISYEYKRPAMIRLR